MNKSSTQTPSHKDQTLQSQEANWIKTQQKAPKQNI
jgi:hypothetical protein